MNLELARAVADAVLYEGYLLYPYRASSAKNHSRWQFGVLGPPGAADGGVGEASSMSMQCLLSTASVGAGPTIVVHLRFLQIQARQVERYDNDRFLPVAELTVDGTTSMSWDEAVEREITLEPYDLQAGAPAVTTVEVPGGEDNEQLTDASGAVAGRIVRRRWPLVARVTTSRTEQESCQRLEVGVENLTPAGTDEGRQSGRSSAKDEATHASLIGAHLLLEAAGVSFVSLLEPPDDAVEAAASCHQDRCWPVLTGSPGDTDLVLGSPIILYDYPEVAAESAGALFDSTEIDEILTLRVMTMTEEEKREARATDPRAKEIIDRCDEMSPETLQRLHGTLRDPRLLGHLTEPADLRNVEPASFDTGDVPWWDPAADEAVRPETDAVVIDGVRVSKGSLVRVHPSRRADAQDLFFADQVARVTAVLSDVDGGVHVALVLVDDPAADLHEWYGRYFYFAPDELEPLPADAVDPFTREESRS